MFQLFFVQYDYSSNIGTKLAKGFLLLFYFSINQIYSSHTQHTKAETYTVYSKCGATGSSQRADAPLMGYPVSLTKTLRTESNATHEIKNYYQDTLGTKYT